MEAYSQFMLELSGVVTLTAFPILLTFAVGVVGVIFYRIFKGDL